MATTCKGIGVNVTQCTSSLPFWFQVSATNTRSHMTIWKIHNFKRNELLFPNLLFNFFINAISKARKRILIFVRPKWADVKKITAKRLNEVTTDVSDVTTLFQAGVNWVCLGVCRRSEAKSCRSHSVPFDWRYAMHFLVSLPSSQGSPTTWKAEDW